MFSFLYILSTAVGFGFLIFIHELGHYFVAKRVGMRVEAFSIGFGKPLYKWHFGEEVWQICLLPFGGYVKMAGMEAEEGQDPETISNGFWEKSPWARIQVALAGPAVNLGFALLVFSLMWLGGGREKNFSEYTQRVGWVDPASELYGKGVRPGDLIQAYQGRPFVDHKDHLYAAMLGGKEVEVKGISFDPRTGEPEPFFHEVQAYQHPLVSEEGILTTGVLGSAGYLIYDRLPGQKDNPLPENSPMFGSGLQYGDRILWLDGVMVHSLRHLSEVLNGGFVLATVERGGENILCRIPRIPAKELRLSEEMKEELVDWQFAAGKGSQKLAELFFTPYNFNADGQVESRVSFIDQEMEKRFFPSSPLSDLEEPLKKGDRIVALDGVRVQRSYQLFSQIQERHAQVIVQRGAQREPPLSWESVDSHYTSSYDLESINVIAQTIGSAKPRRSFEDYHLLQPVTPMSQKQFLELGKSEAELKSMQRKREKAIQAIEDPAQRSQIAQLLKEQETKLLLGVPGVQDLQVQYNPAPHVQFNAVFQDTWRTLKALVTGYLSPKFVSGPVGIVQVIHQGWSIGVSEVLFWLAVVSLNLGVLNLLPIPVLDGGHVMLSLFELVTGKKLKAKQMEALILPFALIMILLFLFLTFNDLSRLLRGLFF